MDTNSNTTTTTTTTTKPISDMTEESRQHLIDSIPYAPISCKENIQPRKGGRSVAALTTLFESSPQEREHTISLGQTKFQEQLDNLDEVDDPLDIYIQYIAWTHQMYPQGNTLQFMELFKRATETFKTDKRYKSDVRYLKIWLEYAKYVEDAKDIFLFLIKLNIGQTCALFYEEYSTYYEQKKRCDEAIKVYELGIEKEAEPLKRLKRNFELLKARIEERRRIGLLQKEQQQARLQQEALRNTGHRTMLGQRLDVRSRSSMSVNIYHGLVDSSSSPSSSGGLSSLLNRSRTFGNDTSRLSVPRSSSPGFSIYQDNESISSSTILPSRKSTMIPSINSQHIHSSRLENKSIPIDSSTTTLPQRMITPVVEEASFQVYQDTQEEEEEEEKEKEPIVKRLIRSNSALTFSSGIESIVSKLKRSPTEDFISNKRTRPNNIEDVTMSSMDSNNNNFGYEALEIRFKRGQYKKHENGNAYIACSTRCFKHILDGRSLEEYRAIKYEHLKKEMFHQEVIESGFARHRREGLKDEPIVPEYTTETIEAMKIVDAVFDEGASYTEEERDLTWTNPIQRFKQIERSHGNEN